MYGFIATYDNMDTGETREQLIEVEEQLFDNECDIYAHAMRRAYNGMRKNETLDTIKFIYC